MNKESTLPTEKQTQAEMIGRPAASVRRLSVRRLSVLVFAFVIFGYIGFRAIGGVRQLLETGVEFEPRYLFLSWAVHLGSIFLAAAVWTHMLRRLTVTTGYVFNVRVYGVSMLARKIPGTIWYALSRLALYRYDGWPARPVVAALGVELVTLSLAGLVVFVISSTLGFAENSWIGRYVSSAYLYVGTVIFVGLIVWLQPIALRKFMERQQGENSSRQAYQKINIGDSLIWLSGMSAVLFAGAGMIYLLLLSFDAKVPYAAVTSGFALAVALGPIAIWMPADIGLKDGFLYLVMAPFLTEPIAALAVLLIRLWITALEIGFGLICALTFGKPMLQEVFQQENAGPETTPETDTAPAT